MGLNYALQLIRVLFCFVLFSDDLNSVDHCSSNPCYSRVNSTAGNLRVRRAYADFGQHWEVETPNPTLFRGQLYFIW